MVVRIHGGSGCTLGIGIVPSVLQAPPEQRLVPALANFGNIIDSCGCTVATINQSVSVLILSN